MNGRTSKNEVMTKDEMLIECEQRKTASRNRLYKAESIQAANEEISKSVARGLAELELAGTGKHISLNDIDTVRAITMAYLQACSEKSAFPSMAGLARAMGHSRWNLYKVMKEKPNSETTQWLRMFQDLLSDILTENALKGSANNIYAIFIQKAMFGLRDNDPPMASDQEDRYMSDEDRHEEIRRIRMKYADYLSEE